MRAAVRLAAYASSLVLVGGAAAAIGSATGATPPFEGCPGAAPAGSGDQMASGHSGEAMAAAVPGADGTRAELAGVTLTPISDPAGPGRTTWRFAITGCDGNRIRSFERDQTKLLHLIVARTDMTGYQHLHPALGTDGRWSVDADFAQPGRYRAIADFTTAGRRYVLG